MKLNPHYENVLRQLASAEKQRDIIQERIERRNDSLEKMRSNGTDTISHDFKLEEN